MKTETLSIGFACSLTLAAFAQTNCITIPDGEFRSVKCPYVLQGGGQWTILVFPPPPSVTLSVLTWNGFSFDDNVYHGNAGWDSPPIGCFPGSSVILHPTGGAVTVCFPEPTQSPVLPLPLACGFNHVSCQSNCVAGFEEIVGRLPWEGVQVYKLNPGPGRSIAHFAPPDYTVYTFSGGSWSPAAPVADALEAVFVYQPPPRVRNARLVSGHIQFDVTAPPGWTVTVEYADECSSDPASWKSMTSFTGDGTSQPVTDSAEIGTIPKRFYRAR